MLPTRTDILRANAWSWQSTATSAAHLGSSDVEFYPFSLAIDRPYTGASILHQNAFFDMSGAQGRRPCQQPHSHADKETAAMAYKAGEGTLRRLPNTDSHPKNFLPLSTSSMSTMLPWVPLIREPFDLSTLQSKLCDIAKEFLCARWHRQRQAEQVGQQWYEAAVRNQARVPHDSRVASPSVVHPNQRQMSSVSRRRLTGSGNTDRSRPHGLRQDLPVRLSTNPEPSVSPAQPAILTSVANIWAGVQDLTLKDLTLSDEFDDIHCVFCLAEDDDLANESVILRCQCKALSHLACAEEWLEKRIETKGL
ncbi:hypothetical protein PENFLA_c089G04837 [Penicillium flavigenum]|uniref:RING-CH-type domain-containing protein n=1 Tax=Penicillium flavigenum TaxID=254877 RepID=A0A1V6SA01_9EURO|nr:hypothetical protein PENFLA_c089G04837 [Penicillium flavigenum]